MSVSCMVRVWEQSKRTADNEVLLLLAIADHADDEGICWPGIERLALKTRKKARQVQRNIRALEGTGELYVAHSVGGRSKSNLYLVACGLDKPELTSTLMRRFGLPKPVAEVAAQGILDKQNTVPYDTVYKENPAMDDTVLGDETVSSMTQTLSSKAETVSSVVENPVIAMTPESMNHHETIMRTINNGAEAPPESSKSSDKKSDDKPRDDKSKEPETPLQRQLRAMWNVKRINCSQAEIITEFAAYPYKIVIEAAKWAHTKNMPFGDALLSMKAALPKWGQKRSGNNGANRGSSQKPVRSEVAAATGLGSWDDVPIANDS